MKAETAMWTMEEELVVSRPPAPFNEDSRTPMLAAIRGLAFVGAVVSALVALVRSFDIKRSRQLVATPSKYYV